MSSTFNISKRLLSTFVRRYTGRLAIGILAGLVAGGSLFGILKFSPGLVRPFESRPEQPGMVAEGGAPARSVRVDEDLDTVDRIAARLGLPRADADGRFSWQLMTLAIGGMLLFFLFKAAATFVNRYFLRWVGARTVVDIRNALFDCLQGQSLRFYGKTDVGQLISRCTYDTAIIERAIAGTVADLSRAPIEIFAAGAYVVLTALEQGLGEIVVVLFIGFPLCMFPVIILGRYVKRYTRRSLKRISNLVSRMEENFTGIRVVKAYNMEAAESARFQVLNDSYFAAIIKALRAELMMTPMVEFVGITLFCAFLVLCYARGVRLDQILPMGGAAVFAYRPMKQLAKLNVNIQRGVAAGERIFALLDTDTSLTEAQDPVRLSSFDDKIVFDQVSFAYEPDSPPVLADISFEVPRGSVVAFVGETGSGKTTVANLLARFYDPDAGRVLLDGHDLRDLEIAAVRGLIGIVTQETILFNDTIANNIGYGTPGATREQIEEAARTANAHEFIIAEQGGYDRVVGDKGFVLSGGQRQRVAVARAILKNPPILILDEATSALDTATEQLVQEAINKVMAHRTVFAIAHRLSTVKHADLICVLDKGRIVERGTHAQLYAAEGMYRRLCDMQLS